MTTPPELATASDPRHCLEAQGAFADALATFQATAPTTASYAMEDVLAALAPAHALGFAYSISHSPESICVSLLHRSGWDQFAHIDEGSPWEALAQLAGIRLGAAAKSCSVAAPVAAAQPQPALSVDQNPEPAAAEAPASDADEFADVDPIGPGAPDSPVNAEDRQPLTESDRETCLGLIRGLTVEQRKSFTIAFRSHFNIDRNSRTIAPHIVQVQHQRFIHLFIDELELSGAAA